MEAPQHGDSKTRILRFKLMALHEAKKADKVEIRELLE